MISVGAYVGVMSFYSLVISILLYISIAYFGEKKYFLFSVHITLAISIVLQMAKFVFNS